MKLSSATVSMVLLGCAAWGAAAQDAAQQDEAPRAAVERERQPWEGSYSNGTVTIVLRQSDTGETNVVSTRCKDEAFHPRLDAEGRRLIGEKRKYVIRYDRAYTYVDARGANACIPLGRYRRVR